MNFFIYFILFIFAPILSFAERCTPQVESCGYYLCEEKNYRCGPKGYPLGFGFKFCQVYLNTEQSYSPEAHAWLRKVRVCLMKKLEAINDTAARTCGEIKKKSFSSHVDCYVSTGFCDLSAKDKLQIFWPMRTSFVHPEVFSDAYSVAQICFSKTALSPEALNVPK